MFNYQKAQESGYSEDEILNFLSEKNPNFNIQAAQQSGYSPQEISQFLSTPPKKEEKSTLEKGARIAGQFALGAAESAAFPYEVAVAVHASKPARQSSFIQTLRDEMTALEEEKSIGIWNKASQEKYDYAKELLSDPEKLNTELEKISGADIGVRGLAEKATGLDLKPEGIAEKAANWMGFLKDPKKIIDVAKIGLNPKEIIKSIIPTGQEFFRGVGAGAALEMAEEGEFGPIGTMAAAVVGDVLGAGTKAGVGIVSRLATEPKKVFAEAAAKFTPKDKIKLQKEIVKDFRDANLQADLGTITDSNLIKMTQSRLAQSGLTGKALDEFKEGLTNQIKEEYRALADGLGEAKFSSAHEAGTIVKETISKIREADLAETRNFYKRATESLKDKSFVRSERIANAVENIEKQLKPGQIKSGEQKIVLDTLEKLKKDFTDSSGKLFQADVKDLMNNKIAINDIINYEVQGGAKQLLKNVVKEIDRAIISHGKENPSFAKNYINANKRFSEHAKTFRNKNIEQMIRAQDPAQLLNKMNTIQGMRDLEKVLNKSPEGKELYQNLKRQKLDQVIGKNLVDSTSQQAKLGTFSKLLEKGKNREVIKEVLGPKEFKRLERLQKNAGRLADAANKFYNASKSGTVAADAAILAKGMSDVAYLLMGNPWPMSKTVGVVLGARRLSGLLADPEFLKLAEEAILASEKGSQKDLFSAFEKLRPYILQASSQTSEIDNDQNKMQMQ